MSSCPTARLRIDQLLADQTASLSGSRSLRHGAARRATDRAGVFVTGFRLRQHA